MSERAVRSECLVWPHMHSGFGVMAFPPLYPADVIQDVKEEEILPVETSLGCKLGGIG